MEYGHIVYSQVLATMTVLVSFTTICADRPTISLKVMSDFDESCRRVSPKLICKTGTDAAGIYELSSLTLFGSHPNEIGNDLDQLATLNISSKTPKLAKDLKELGAFVDGKLHPANKISSYLVLFWPANIVSTQHVYTCVAKGNKRDGQVATVSMSVYIENVNADCEKSKLQVALTDLPKEIGMASNLTMRLTSQMLSLGHKYEGMQSTCTAAGQKMATRFKSEEKSLDDFKHVYTKFRTHSSHVNTLTDKLEDLQENLNLFVRNINYQFRLLDFDRKKFFVSTVYEGRVYLIAKASRGFNIEEANKLCMESGGYLVELNDNQEFQFVSSLKDPHERVPLWTGANDIDNEGTFVYYNSKKPVPPLKWMAHEPNNALDGEHCVEITSNGFNDFPCNLEGRVVCEVPIEISA